jgi:hypothetical protein
MGITDSAAPHSGAAVARAADAGPYVVIGTAAQTFRLAGLRKAATFGDCGH